jgi:hypothetical protein
MRPHDAVYGIPALRLDQLLRTLPLDPAKKALDPGMLLHVVGAILTAPLSRLVVGPHKPMLFFQLSAHGASHLIVTVGLMDGVPDRMDLVDRNMDMEIIRVMVNSADPLMLAVTNRRAHAIFNIAQDLRGRLLTRRKRNQ